MLCTAQTFTTRSGDEVRFVQAGKAGGVAGETVAHMKARRAADPSDTRNYLLSKSELLADARAARGAHLHYDASEASATAAAAVDAAKTAMEVGEPGAEQLRARRLP